MRYLDVSKFDVSKFNGIKSCKIFDQPYSRNLGFGCVFDMWLQAYDKPFEIKFKNGIAIARVFIDGLRYGDKSQYVTYAIIKEVKSKDTDEVGDYELVDVDDDYFKLPRYIEDITRVDNHFFFAIRTSKDDEGNFTYTAHWQYDYDPKTNTFVKIGKLDSEPIITKNEDIVIMGGCRLYSLSKKDYVSDSYSSIEDNNGETFFVTDYISSKEIEDEKINNLLMFDIDKNGKRISNVYSRNAGEPTKDELSTPYEEIKKREIKKLNDLLDKENTYKLLLKVEENEQ